MNNSKIFAQLSQITLGASIFILLSCAAPIKRIPVHLYAVKGEGTTLYPEVQGVATPVGIYRGSITLTWPNGETGTGQYSGIANLAMSSGSYSSHGRGYGTSNYSGSNFQGTTYGPHGMGSYSGNLGPSTTLTSTYQSIYGRSFRASLAPGQIPIQGFMITNQGRRVEFIGAAGSGTDHGYGVAKDSKGNTYRIIF